MVRIICEVFFNILILQPQFGHKYFVVSYIVSRFHNANVYKSCQKLMGWRSLNGGKNTCPYFRILFFPIFYHFKYLSYDITYACISVKHTYVCNMSYHLLMLFLMKVMFGRWTYFISIIKVIIAYFLLNSPSTLYKDKFISILVKVI